MKKNDDKILKITIVLYYCFFRDCPGVGTSSGPSAKDIYHGGVGGPSVGYKTNSQQHPQQSRVQVPIQPLPSSHFSQEPSGQQQNSPPLRLNICGQENTMRSPLININAGLGPSVVEMDYRRSSQGNINKNHKNYLNKLIIII